MSCKILGDMTEEFDADSKETKLQLCKNVRIFRILYSYTLYNMTAQSIFP